MKIIDILNEINNNEEVPEKVKFQGDIYKYDKKMKEYLYEPEEFVSYSLLYAVMNGHRIKEILETEVEVIEENEEIEIQKIKPFIIPRIAESKEKDMWTDRIMINKLIESVKQLDNKLNKEREEK